MADLDPKFETRAELEAWAAKLMQDAASSDAQIPALGIIQRVTLAHSHLIGDT